MAKLSFSSVKGSNKTTAEDTEKVSVVEVEQPSKTVAVVPQQSVASSYIDDEDASGDFMGAKYGSHPTLRIVSKTSELAENFKLGAWVVGDKGENRAQIGTMDEPLTIICVKFAMAWQEVLPFGTQTTPKYFQTLQDAVNEGYTNEWDTPIPRVAEVIKALFWVPLPETAEEGGIPCLESPMGYGTLAWFFAAKTTFGTVGKSLIQAKRSFLTSEKGGMRSGQWSLTASKMNKNGFSWLLPKISPKGKTPKDMVAFLENTAS